MKKLLAGVLCMFALSMAHAQQIVRVVIPVPAGGATAVLATKWIDQLNTELTKDKIQLVPEYKPGAAGKVGTQYVLAQPKNELTLMFTSNQILTHYAVDAKSDYVMHQDLKAMAYAGTTPMMIVTGKNSAYNSWQDVVAASKNKKIFMGHGGNGSAAWVAAISLSRATNTSYDLVAYKGSAPALVDTIAGHVDISVDFYNTALPQINSGNLKPLLVLGDERLSELPNVPSFRDISKSSFEASVWWGIYSNNTTATREAQAVQRAIDITSKNKDFVKTLKDSGVSLPTVNIKSHIDNQLRYLKTLNLKLD